MCHIEKEVSREYNVLNFGNVNSSVTKNNWTA